MIMSYFNLVMKSTIFYLILTLSFFHEIMGQKFRINDVYYDVDNAFPNAKFVTINSVDPLLDAYGIINLETLETVGRNIYKTKSESDNFQDTALPFLIKKANKNEVHVAWSLKQLEKNKFFKLQKIRPPNDIKIPRRISPNSNHAIVYIIFKSASTVTLSNGQLIEPELRAGIFNPQVVKLMIYNEGRLGFSINEGANKTGVDLFYGDEYYLLADYRNSNSYLDFYPAYMGKPLIETLESRVMELKDIRLSDSKVHDRVYAIREIEELKRILKDSISTFNPDIQLNSDQWVYTGIHQVNGKAHGIGDAIAKNGEQFIISGYFQNGDFVRGVIYSIYGEQMIGDFINYQLHGAGHHILKEGTIFSGTFQNGLMQGEGTMTTSTGTIYKGGFVDYLISGKGRFDVANGDYYVGSFLNGVPHGTGLFNTNGKVENCEYQDGLRIDRVYLTKVENLKNNYLASLTNLTDKKKLRFLNNQRKLRNANNLFKELAYCIGNGQNIPLTGIDTKKIIKKLPRAFPGVISNITDDLMMINERWIYEPEALYLGEYDLFINTPLSQFPKSYIEIIGTVQLFKEELFVKIAEQYKIATEAHPAHEISDDVAEEPIEAEGDDWGWEDTSPIEKQPVAEHVWISGIYDDNATGCRHWKWSKYSIEMKSCQGQNEDDFIEISNKDYDPVRANFMLQLPDMSRSMEWPVELDPDQRIKQYCKDCFRHGKNARMAFLKEFELILDE